MRIVLAPDKFKGSLTARQVCEALREGFLSVDPSIQIESIPMADGGEGTCELLTNVSGGSIVEVSVKDPLAREIRSSYGISRDGKTAFIEMASASGLQLLKEGERNPMITTTYGTGQLIVHALESGAINIIVAIGGSATNDAGIGMADALGFMFMSESGKRLIPIGKVCMR